MYTLTTEASFDSAHFLAGYNGKCSNIHGHRWMVRVEAGSSQLTSTGQLRGMVMDFGDLKKEVQKMTDYFDHALIIEQHTLQKRTFSALQEEGFNIIEVAFRPTAENFARHFYDYLAHKQLPVQRVTVFETPNNCAAYSEVEQ